MNVFIIVEGYTELSFVNEIVAPHLRQNGAQVVTAFVVATNADLGKKGGGKNYEHLKNDILNTIGGKKDKIVTTFIDYYGLPANFPNYEVCRKEISIDDKIKCLEESIKENIAPNNQLFLPYIQKHEFEALLFSSNIGFEVYFETETYEKTHKIINKFENPEDINDDTETAPSKRLIKIIPNYDKRTFGNIIALEIGLDQMLEKCPRFNNWIENLINLI